MEEEIQRALGMHQAWQPLLPSPHATVPASLVPRQGPDQAVVSSRIDQATGRVVHRRTTVRKRLFCNNRGFVTVNDGPAFASQLARYLNSVLLGITGDDRTGEVGPAVIVTRAIVRHVIRHPLDPLPITRARRALRQAGHNTVDRSTR
jgi:hypothetical protein